VTIHPSVRLVAELKKTKRKKGRQKDTKNGRKLP